MDYYNFRFKVLTAMLYAYNKANKVSGMIRRTIVNKEPRIMMRLCKTLVRPHVECCSSAWSPLYKKDKESIDKIQHRFTKMIQNMEGRSYDDRLRYLGLWTLEERRNRQDLIELFKIFKGLSRVQLMNCMLNENTKGTWCHCLKLRKTSVHQGYH